MKTVHRIPDEEPAPAMTPEQIARDAIRHTLETIATSPARFWLMGNGTESFAQLTAAYAALVRMPVEEVRAYFQPNRAEYEAFQAERRADQDSLDLVENLRVMAGTRDPDKLAHYLGVGLGVCERSKLNAIDGGAR